MTDANELLGRCRRLSGDDSELGRAFRELDKLVQDGQPPKGWRLLCDCEDSAEFPWAQDLDSVWHRRPTGDRWIAFDTRGDGWQGPQCMTACGKAIWSVHVSGFQPEADEATGATLCECVSADPGVITESSERIGT